MIKLERLQFPGFKGWIGEVFIILYLLRNCGAGIGISRNCSRPLGMQDGRILDSQLSSSSSYEPNLTGASNARLHTERGGGAWCPRTLIDNSKEEQEYLEIDLGDDYLISGIVTQGRFANGLGQEFAEYYTLEYWRSPNPSFTTYTEENGVSVIEGNKNTFQPVQYNLSKVIVASKLRIVPFSLNPRTVCLRVELKGCPYPGNFFSLLKDETRDENENGYYLAESAGEDDDWNESTYLAIAIGILCSVVFASAAAVVLVVYRNNLHKKTSSLSKYNFFSEESDTSLKNQTLQDSISTVDPSLNGSSYNPNYYIQDAFIRHSSLPNSGRIQHSGKVEIRTLSRVPEPGQGWGALGTDLGRFSTSSREPYPAGRKEKNQYYRRDILGLPRRDIRGEGGGGVTNARSGSPVLISLKSSSSGQSIRRQTSPVRINQRSSSPNQSCSGHISPVPSFQPAKNQPTHSITNSNLRSCTPGPSNYRRCSPALERKPLPPRNKKPSPVFSDVIRNMPEREILNNSSEKNNLRNKTERNCPNNSSERDNLRNSSKSSDLHNITEKDNLHNYSDRGRMRNTPASDIIRTIQNSDVLRTIPNSDVLRTIPNSDVLRTTPERGRRRSFSSSSAGSCSLRL